MSNAEPPIEHAVWIDAKPEVVFEYFVDPLKLVRWMGLEASLEPVPFGSYDVRFKEGWHSRGQFLVVERPRRLVYTVGWVGHDQFPPGSTRVELLFTPERGGTKLLLRHFGPPTSGLESEGWAAYLSRLTAVVEQRSPGTDPFHALAPGD